MASSFYWKFAPVSLDWAPLGSHNMPTLVYPYGRRRNFRLTALPNVTVNIRIEGLYDQQGGDSLDIWTIQWLGDGNVATLEGGQEIFISFDPKTSVAPQPGTYQLRVATSLGGLEMQDLGVNLVLNPAVENNMAPAPMGPDDGPHGGGGGGGVGHVELPGIGTIFDSNYCVMSGAHGF